MLTADRIQAPATKIGKTHIAENLTTLVTRAQDTRMGYLDFVGLLLDRRRRESQGGGKRVSGSRLCRMMIAAPGLSARRPCGIQCGMRFAEQWLWTERIEACGNSQGNKEGQS